MHDIIFQIVAIVISGAILGLSGFGAKMLWDLREQWILDHAWQKTAQDTLLKFGSKFDDHNTKFETVMIKLNGLDGRITSVEHPLYPLPRRTKRQTGGTQ